jgi:hypothetical protein
MEVYQEATDFYGLIHARFIITTRGTILKLRNGKNERKIFKRRIRRLSASLVWTVETITIGYVRLSKDFSSKGYFLIQGILSSLLRSICTLEKLSWFRWGVFWVFFLEYFLISIPRALSLVGLCIYTKDIWF